MKRRPLLLFLALVAAVGAIGVTGVGIGWAVVCGGTKCPSLEQLEKYQPRQTSRLYAADGRFIADICPQVIECGPTNASIHKINECIRVDELQQLPQIYLHTLKNLLIK